MAQDSSRRTLTRLHAVTGAPALVLGWALALVVGLPLSHSVTVPLDWLGRGAALAAWWSLVALATVTHLGASGLLVRRAARRAPSIEVGTDDAAPTPSRVDGHDEADGHDTEHGHDADHAAEGPGRDDDGRVLRVGAGGLCLTATLLLLGVLAPAVFGAATSADVYLTLDALLSILPGVGVACVLGAASALYVAEELPRAAHALGLRREGSAARATLVTSIVVGATLFLLTMDVVSHFSSAAGLVSP